MSRVAVQWSISGLPVTVSRRRFVIGLGAAGVATATLIPAGVDASVAPGIAASGGGLEEPSVDAVWGHYPAYSAQIGFGRAREREAPACAELADALLAELAS